jgi:leucyl-tRNA synthetase
VTQDIESLRLNTAVSQMMIFANHLTGLGEAPPRDAIRGLLLCLAPFAPHLAEELWQSQGQVPCISTAPWPQWDEALCVDDIVEVPIQINGKVRGRVLLPVAADQETAREAALAEASVQHSLAGKALVKVVYVPGRVLNLIVGK